MSKAIENKSKYQDINSKSTEARNENLSKYLKTQRINGLRHDLKRILLQQYIILQKQVGIDEDIVNFNSKCEELLNIQYKPTDVVIEVSFDKTLNTTNYITTTIFTIDSHGNISDSNETVLPYREFYHYWRLNDNNLGKDYQSIINKCKRIASRIISKKKTLMTIKNNHLELLKSIKNYKTKLSLLKEILKERIVLRKLDKIEKFNEELGFDRANIMDKIRKKEIEEYIDESDNVPVDITPTIKEMLEEQDRIWKENELKRITDNNNTKKNITKILDRNANNTSETTQEKIQRLRIEDDNEPQKNWFNWGGVKTRKNRQSRYRRISRKRHK